VIKDDNTVTVRVIKVGTVDGELTQVTDARGRRKVVADGRQVARRRKSNHRSISDTRNAQWRCAAQASTRRADDAA